MKINPVRTTFLVEHNETLVKVAKAVVSASGKQFTAFENAPCSAGNAAKVADKIAELLGKMGWRHDDVAFSLPRHLATLRCLKIPAREPLEIERMVAFQAPRHLPYPAEELVTAYEVLDTDNAGYSRVNLAIVHKQAVAPYLDVCRRLKIARPFIVLSSYGLCQAFQVLRPEEDAPVIILDVDDQHAEFAVAAQGRLMFSRALKFHGFQNGWQALLLEELGRTLEVYVKEVGQERPGKIFLLGNNRSGVDLAGSLKASAPFLVEEIPMNGHIPITDAARDLLVQPVSFFTLIGLGLMELKVSMSLLPTDMKARIRQRDMILERARTFLILAAAVLLFGLSLSLNVHNKSMYLGRLKTELNRIQKEAAPLEEIDRRVNVLKKGLGARSGLNVIYGVQALIPEGVSLNTFEYSELGKILLRGQARELDMVFALARAMENSSDFKGYAIVVNYATKKKTTQGDAVDFEISGRRP